MYSPFHPVLSYVYSYGAGARVGIIGSRSYTSPLLVREIVNLLPLDSVIVSGNGGIVDITAIDTARQTGRPYTVYKPDWSYNRKGAGLIRNKKIVQEGLSCLIAFLTSLSCPSTGSSHTMQQAFEIGIPVFMFGPADDWLHSREINKQLSLEWQENAPAILP